MVRAWHPHLIHVLDDNRLPANHVESHYMHTATLKAKGWFNHPETQIWVGRSNQLRWLHDLTVAEMEIRGYVHKSPIDGDRAPVLPDFSGLLSIPYKLTWDDWYERDLADLYAKFTKEDRFDSNGYPKLGRRHVNKKDGTVSYKEPRRKFTQEEMDLIHHDRLLLAEKRIGVREWTPEQTQRLRELVTVRLSEIQAKSTSPSAT